MKKRISAILWGCMMMAAIAAGCGGTAVDKPCDWCGKSPSIAYQVSDGSDSYVCKECSKKCALCGKKATKQSENMLGMAIFLCDDCYQEAGGK